MGHDTSYYLVVESDGQLHIEGNTSYEQPYKTDRAFTIKREDFSKRVVDGKTLAELVTEKLAQIPI